jgi:thiamine-phosphate pyrophosphorylase
MYRRQPLPRFWMMTDERQGDGLFAALARLPKGAGIVFRHYRLPSKERRQLFLKAQKIARRRGLLIMLGGSPRLAAAWGADGSHGPVSFGRSPTLLHSAAVHSLPQLRIAERISADFVFLSPVFPTCSHPRKRALGPVRFGLIARQTRIPVIALGGMNASRAQRLSGHNLYGWGGIDVWNANQN